MLKEEAKPDSNGVDLDRSILTTVYLFDKGGQMPTYQTTIAMTISTGAKYSIAAVNEAIDRLVEGGLLEKETVLSFLSSAEALMVTKKGLEYLSL